MGKYEIEKLMKKKNMIRIICINLYTAYHVCKSFSNYRFLQCISTYTLGFLTLEDTTTTSKIHLIYAYYFPYLSHRCRFDLSHADIKSNTPLINFVACFESTHPSLYFFTGVNSVSC